MVLDRDRGPVLNERNEGSSHECPHGWDSFSTTQIFIVIKALEMFEANFAPTETLLRGTVVLPTGLFNLPVFCMFKIK